MAQTPEVKVKHAVRTILDEHGVYYFCPPANGYGRQGIPDIICWLDGHFIAIECKAGKGVTTVLQEREIAKIRKAHGTAWVINETNVGQLKEWLMKIEDLYGKLF